MTSRGKTGPTVESIRARAFTVPTDTPESDGTFAWTETTLVLVEARAADETGIGYSYTHAAAAMIAATLLAKVVVGRPAFDPAGAAGQMRRAVRNIGRSGVAATALSAVDAAVWDLKARLLGLPLVSLLGQVRPAAPIYGSGGFTSYDDAQMTAQLSGWVERDGCRAVKIKIGRDPGRDPHRAAVARRAVGDAELFVDANGAFARRQAIDVAHLLAEEADIRWFEEPVSSDDLAGLREVRDAAPPGVEIAAGEYAYTLDDLRHMLAAGAIDVQQADATRCGGITGFMEAGVLADAHHTDLSAHCGPALHLHPACAVQRFRNIEWFHDHVRIERMLFDGAPVPRGGQIAPDLSRPGMGLAFKHVDAERYAAGPWEESD